MNGQPRGLLTRFLQFFFYLLYQPLAWSYDLVAWLVSLGHWSEWIRVPLPYVDGPRVLELGHGPGHLQLALTDSDHTVFGLDRSRQMGGLARGKLQNAGHKQRLVRANGQRLPYRAKSFEQIVATFPTEYILHPDTLNEIKRVLVAGGEALILPVAWITGRDLLSRAAAALFRITGQAGEWDGRFTQVVMQAGFDVEENPIDLSHGRVMLLIARPKGIVQ